MQHKKKKTYFYWVHDKIFFSYKKCQYKYIGTGYSVVIHI